MVKKVGAVLLGVLAGCGGGGYGTVRTTRVEVRPVCPKPEEPPDALFFLQGVVQIPPDAMGLARDRAFESYLESGALPDRLSALVLALAGPPDPARDARLIELLSKDPSAHLSVEGPLGELDEVLRRAFVERFRDAGREEIQEAKAARERVRSRKIAARLAESKREVQNLQKRFEIQEKRLKTLEAQLEELKGIERIIDRREQTLPGG